MTYLDDKITSFFPHSTISGTSSALTLIRKRMGPGRFTKGFTPSTPFPATSSVTFHFQENNSSRLALFRSCVLSLNYNIPIERAVQVLLVSLPTVFHTHGMYSLKFHLAPPSFISVRIVGNKSTSVILNSSPLISVVVMRCRSFR